MFAHFKNSETAADEYDEGENAHQCDQYYGDDGISFVVVVVSADVECEYVRGGEIVVFGHVGAALLNVGIPVMRDGAELELKAGGRGVAEGALCFFDVDAFQWCALCLGECEQN